jgi:hypothetical protein
MKITVPFDRPCLDDEPTKAYVDRQVQGQMSLPLDDLPEPRLATPPAKLDPGPADVELVLVLAFVEQMPTWDVAEVIAVKEWLISQLALGVHRRLVR